MTLTQTAVLWAAQLAVALAIAGLLLRGHARFCRTFVAYLAVVLVCDVLLATHPERFFNWTFWLFEHFAFDVLKIAVAVECAYWTFKGFDGAARTARGTLLLLLIATLGAVVALPHEGVETNFVFGVLQPRIVTATVWLFTALAALVAWYRIPAYPVHLGIMIGFVPYLVVFTIVMRLMVAFGYGERLATVEPAAYLGTCTWWARMAWRPSPAVDGTVARLQAWRRL